MNLRIKRCMFGLMTWAALTGVAVAQPPGESEGTVTLGQPPAAAQGQPQVTEGAVRLGTAPPSASPAPLQPLDGTGQVNPGEYFGITPVERRFQPKFNVDSRGGGLYGYNAGYTTLGGFVPFAIEGEEAIVFVDARGLLSYDDGGGGANVGAGWRWWMRDYDRIVGLSAWYDNSNGGIGPNFNQIGLSFESLGRYVDYRINGYIPAGMHDHIGTSTLNNTASCFGNNIVFQRTTETAQAYTGFDIETGGPLPILGRYGVNGYVGGYHFMGAGATGGSFTGVSGRFMSQINEDVSFGMQVTNDHTFGLNTQFQVFVTLPDGVPSRWMRNPTVQDRLTQSVFRQFRAITHIDNVQTSEAAINPTTGNPYFVAFINPNNATPGTGTNGNAFNSIAQYNGLTAAKKAAYDVILVNGRTDGSSINLDTGLGTPAPALGLQLANNQRLWGGGLTHSFVTTTGTFLFNCNDVATTPILVNEQTSGGNVVTLTNNNEVSGVTINGATPLGVQNFGVVSRPGGITGGFNINNTTFTNTLEAVRITHSGSALGLLTNNTVTGGPSTGPAVGFQSNAGFNVTQTSGTLSLLVQNNTITDIKGEDANGDGLLSPGEDTNSNGVLDMGIGMRFVATGATAVINANDPFNVTQPLGILNNTVSGSGAGIDLQALAGGTFNASVSGNALSNNTTGSSATPTNGFGFAATASGAGSVMTIDTYTDNTTSGNEGDGAVLTANNGGVLNVTGDIIGPSAGGTTTGDTFSNNLGDGLRIQSDNGTIVVKSLTGTTFDTNGANGLNLVTTNGGQITVTDPLSGNFFTNNVVNGMLVDAQSGTINVLVNSTTAANTFTGNGTGALGGDGLLFRTATGGIINTDVVGVTSTGNGSDGIGFFLDGGTINVANIQTNIATGNGRDGLSIINSNAGIFSTNLIGGLVPALGNDFSNNTRAGLFFGGVLPPTPISTNNIVRIANNNFDRTTAGTEGILFDTTNVVTWGGAGAQTILTQNSFVGGALTTGRGVGGTVNGGGLLFAFGDNQTSNANTFTSNVDAHIGLVLSGNSANRITIDNHVLSGVVNGANTTFNGEGAAFILQDSATLTGFIQRSTFQTNAGDGIRFDVAGTNGALFASLNDFVIGGANPLLGNVIGGTGAGNGGNGIAVTRTANGQVNNMQILNNAITGNVFSGMHLLAANNGTTDTYTITNNNVSTNRLDGILLDVQADAGLQATINTNTITGNGTANNPFFGSGIHTIEQANTPTDLRFITGIWTNNTITGNRLDGIDLDSNMTTLVIGDPIDTTLGNNISANFRNGVNVEGPGEVTIGSNLISLNGTVLTVGTNLETAGVKANVRPFSNLTVINNQIINNLGDGIEYSIAQGFGGSSQVQIVGNNIAVNDGRGVDILNRIFNDIQVSMTDNVVNGNRLEGVYVVNTTSGTQDQFSSSTLPLAQDGNMFFNPTIEMQFVNNEVIGNGFGTTGQPGGAPSSTGLVVRVGTSGATQSGSDDGGFASFGNFIAVGGTPFGESTGRGGVTLVVDNNTFGGNFGDDILFQSFVSTRDPNTGAAWNTDPANAAFDLSGYESDPLSRLDVHFHNNTFDSQDVNNTSGVVTGNPQFVAFYNNADGVFKSRLNNIAAPNGAGPFSSASRRRNAQRQAARIPFFTAPLSPIGASFLYPGIGDSTFRVSTDSDLTPFVIDFNVPNTTTNDQNGFFIPNPIGNGERPFGWGTY